MDEENTIKEIMAWDREISKNTAFEIGEAPNYFFIGEMTVGRLEFAKFLERNGSF
jgi:hypothetical protein